MAHERREASTPVYAPEKGGSHAANNGSDAPVVQLVSLDKLAYTIIGRCDAPVCEVNNQVHRITVEKDGRRKSVLEVIPIGVKPILAPTVVSWGGGRTIGGGTSKEALRRQRNKARNGHR